MACARLICFLSDLCFGLLDGLPIGVGNVIPSLQQAEGVAKADGILTYVAV
jgi:hypothetical protein